MYCRQYSKKYIPFEERAQEEHRGVLWCEGCSFELPEAWRVREREERRRGTGNRAMLAAMQRARLESS